jgi:thioredoxin 1
MTGTMTLTDEIFSSRIQQSPELWVVDFWAPWCMPCLALAPALEQLASRYDGRVTIGKLNVDEYPVTASRFAVRSIPTLLFFRGGEVLERMTGLVPRAEIAARIDKHLSASAH